MKPLIAALGLAGLGGFSWLGWSQLHQDVATDLTARAQTALESNDLGGLSVQFDHLDGHVKGATTPELKEAARKAIHSSIPVGRLFFEGDATTAKTSDSDPSTMGLVGGAGAAGAAAVAAMADDDDEANTSGGLSLNSADDVEAPISNESETPVDDINEPDTVDTDSQLVASDNDSPAGWDSDPAPASPPDSLSDNAESTIVEDPVPVVEEPVDAEDALATNEFDANRPLDAQVADTPTDAPVSLEDTTSSLTTTEPASIPPSIEEPVAETQVAVDDGFNQPADNSYSSTLDADVIEQADPPVTTQVQPIADEAWNTTLPQSDADAVVVENSVPELSTIGTPTDGPGVITTDVPADLTDSALADTAAAATSALAGTEGGLTDTANEAGLNPPGIEAPEATTTGTITGNNVLDDTATILEGVPNNGAAPGASGLPGVVNDGDSLANPATPLRENVLRSNDAVPGSGVRKSPLRDSVKPDTKTKEQTGRVVDAVALPPRLGVYMTGQPNDAMVRRVEAGSAAAVAGLRIGDRIRSFGTQSISQFSDLANGVRRHKAGDRVEIVFERGGVLYRRTAQLKPREATMVVPPRGNSRTIQPAEGNR